MTSSSAEDLLRSKPPTPRDRALHAEAIRIGQSVGAAHSAIWDAPGQIIVGVDAAVMPEIDRSLGDSNRDLGPYHLLNIALFLGGVGALVSSITTPGAIVWWAVISAVWLISVVHTKFIQQQKVVTRHEGRRVWLLRVGGRSAYATAMERKAKAMTYDPANRDSSVPFESQGAAPEPQPYGVSHEDTELLSAAWMSYLGATGVAVTPVV